MVEDRGDGVDDTVHAPFGRALHAGGGLVEAGKEATEYAGEDGEERCVVVEVGHFPVHDIHAGHEEVEEELDVPAGEERSGKSEVGRANWNSEERRVEQRGECVGKKDVWCMVS